MTRHEMMCGACQRLLPRLDYQRDKRERERRRELLLDRLAVRLAVLDAIGVLRGAAIDELSAPQGFHTIVALEDVHRIGGAL